MIAVGLRFFFLHFAFIIQHSQAPRDTLRIMETRSFGNTGLSVSIVGLGTVQVGRPSVADADAERLLHAALDAGITLIDTARGYDLAEERIGRFLAHRRDQFVLSTKCGYKVDGAPDWTAECITRGVDAALLRLRTDRIDIMHLHSCPRDTLERGEVIDALDAARRAGKIRVAAYSGENDALDFALACGRFQSIQCSVNICDQGALRTRIPRAAQAGFGVLAKRPLANAFWRFAERPVGDYCEEYWRRAREMRLEAPPIGWTTQAASFVAAQPGVSAMIFGTSSVEHLREVVAAAAQEPLPPNDHAKLRAAFDACGEAWPGQI